MTPGSNGASTPEEDDPFGYLYADGQAAGATPPGGGGGYGYPGSGRSSYQQVRPVGERKYGQQAQAQAPAGAQIPPQHAQYAAPETLPGGQATRQQPLQDGGSGGGRGRGPNTKGLLIGALAVVAAVVIGIGVAMLGSNGEQQDAGDQAGPAGNDTNAGQSANPGDKPSGNAGEGKGKGEDEVELPKEDAKALTLAGGTSTASTIPGAESGTYVQGLNQPGASATWTVSDIPASGKYTLYVGYGVPGKDMSTTLTVNAKRQTRPLNMDNFAEAEEGDWEKGWTNTFANIVLNKGTNTLKISCETGDQCDVNLDQVWLIKGWPES